MAELEYIKLTITPTNPEGLYNQTLERTGSEEIAAKVRNEAIHAIAARQISQMRK